jgi:hypothetical protein
LCYNIFIIMSCYSLIIKIGIKMTTQKSLSAILLMKLIWCSSLFGAWYQTPNYPQYQVQQQQMPFQSSFTQHSNQSTQYFQGSQCAPFTDYLSQQKKPSAPTECPSVPQVQTTSPQSYFTGQSSNQHEEKVPFYKKEPYSQPRPISETTSGGYFGQQTHQACNYFTGQAPQSIQQPSPIQKTVAQLQWTGDFHGAGILPFANDSGEKVVLLGLNRDRHAWEDFGGLRERNENPWQTGSREFFEETKKAFGAASYNPNAYYIQNGSRNPYFMFLVPVAYKDAQELVKKVNHGDEKIDFAWVRVSALYNAIINNHPSVLSYKTNKPLNFYTWFIRTLKQNPQILNSI